MTFSPQKDVGNDYMFCDGKNDQRLKGYSQVSCIDSFTNTNKLKLKI